MIKVYLDWNCITHSKDSFLELKMSLERYNNVFICPYSEAHLRDIQTNHDLNSDYFQKDLDLLTQICGGNMLSIKDNDLELYNVSPREYLSKNGEILDFIQNNFDYPYDAIKQNVRKLIDSTTLSRISSVNDPQMVFSVIDGMVIKDGAASSGIDSVLEQANITGINSFETKIKQAYYTLDLLGFRSEKYNKSFANIDTDAQHIALASLCDYLISDDRRMRDKAKAVYGHIHCATKVMRPQDFIKEIPQIWRKCYDINLIPSIMNTYGFPKTIKEDGAHFVALDYPLLGAFKICYNASALNCSFPDNMAFFVPGQYMFYNELRPLGILTSFVLPESLRQSHIENYIQSYILRKPMGDIEFTINEHDFIFHCVLMTYEGLPALKVSYETR